MAWRWRIAGAALVAATTIGLTMGQLPHGTPAFPASSSQAGVEKQLQSDSGNALLDAPTTSARGEASMTAMNTALSGLLLDVHNPTVKAILARLAAEKTGAWQSLSGLLPAAGNGCAALAAAAQVVHAHASALRGQGGRVGDLADQVAGLVHRDLLRLQDLTGTGSATYRQSVLATTSVVDRLRHQATEAADVAGRVQTHADGAVATCLSRAQARAAANAAARAAEQALRQAEHQAQRRVPTHVVITPATHDIVAGESTSVRVAVAQLTGAPVPAGSVQLYVDGAAAGSIALSGGAATLTISSSALAVGSHAVRVAYSGYAGDQPSAGALEQAVVADGTSTAVSASYDPAANTATVTATVSPQHSGSRCSATGPVELRIDNQPVATLTSTGHGVSWVSPAFTGYRRTIVIAAIYAGSTDCRFSRATTTLAVAPPAPPPPSPTPSPSTSPSATPSPSTTPTPAPSSGSASSPSSAVTTPTPAPTTAPSAPAPTTSAPPPPTPAPSTPTPSPSTPTPSPSTPSPSPSTPTPSPSTPAGSTPTPKPTG